jgi:hypothetical protein
MSDSTILAKESRSAARHELQGRLFHRQTQVTYYYHGGLPVSIHVVPRRNKNLTSGGYHMRARETITHVAYPQ